VEAAGKETGGRGVDEAGPGAEAVRRMRMSSRRWSGTSCTLVGPTASCSFVVDARLLLGFLFSLCRRRRSMEWDAAMAGFRASLTFPCVCCVLESFTCMPLRKLSVTCML
jgi:hypothetical protein